MYVIKEEVIMIIIIKVYHHLMLYLIGMVEIWEMIVLIDPCAQNAASKFACTNAWNWNERLNKAELKPNYKDYDNINQ